MIKKDIAIVIINMIYLAFKPDIMPKLTPSLSTNTILKNGKIDILN
jgi:hypothetical protein